MCDNMPWGVWRGVVLCGIAWWGVLWCAVALVQCTAVRYGVVEGISGCCSGAWGC